MCYLETNKRAEYANAKKALNKKNKYNIQI